MSGVEGMVGFAAVVGSGVAVALGLWARNAAALARTREELRLSQERAAEQARFTAESAAYKCRRDLVDAVAKAIEAVSDPATRAALQALLAFHPAGRPPTPPVAQLPPGGF